MRSARVRLLLLCSFAIGCGGAPRDGDHPLPPFEPAPPVMPRLTAVQYRNALRDVLGEALPPAALEPDTNPYLFFNIGAATTTLSELGTQEYERAAASITEAIFADAKRRDALVRCTPSAPGDACVQQLLSRLGLALLRRPLGAADLARWTTLAREVADGDALRGVRLALYGMLQSPRFLYRTAVGEPDPDAPGRRRYTSYEMAERLSFLLWNTTPDAALLDAAARGELTDTASLQREAERLLESPRAREAVEAFFDQYLDLGDLAQLERDPARYPAASKTLGASLRTEVHLLVSDLVFRRDADILGLFSTRRTFVNAELAALYGVRAPGATEVAFVPVELPAGGPRAGVLTLGAFLALNAHPTETSPTRRGKYVRERLLCQLVPPPPGNVNTNIDRSGGQPRTLRERLEEHRDNPACTGCHAIMDPPGFLFEGFDSVGAYRTAVDGIAVDTRAEIDGHAYQDGRDLGVALAADPNVAECLVKQLYRHAGARLDEVGDMRPIRELSESFARSGHRFRDLLIALVLHEGFRTLAATPEVTP